MARESHSPGPWTFDGPPHNIIVWCGPDKRVAFVMTSDGPAEANARLIAAAPELLASCAEFLPILERQLAIINPGGVAEGSVAFKTASERVERMRAAVAKTEA